MLDEVDAHVTPRLADAQPAEGPLRIRQQRTVALLIDDAVEETHPARAGLAVAIAPRLVAERPRQTQRRGHSLQVHASGVAGRIGLLLIDEAAALVLLKVQRPVDDLERQ